MEHIKEYTPIKVDAVWASEHIPRRPENANKGSFGRALLLVGSHKYRGAAHLALEAALRSGVGYVGYLGTSDLCRELRAKFPETIFYEKEAYPGGVSSFSDIFGGYSSILTGCGSDISEKYFRTLETLVTTDGAPLILDADAINTIARYSSCELFRKRNRPVILTPHPLELSRLSGLSVDEISADRVGVARSFAARYGVILLLKGHGTVITDGEAVYINTSGSTALAKAGSGDVLAGLVAGLIAYSQTPLETVALAAYLHGRAGDTLARSLSELGVTPSDLPRAIAHEIADLQRGRPE